MVANTDVNALQDEMCRLYNVLEEKYFGKGDTIPDQYRHIAYLYLEDEIEHILLKAEDMEQTYQDIQEILRSSDQYIGICGAVSLERAYKKSVVRKDFASALKSVRNGADLSMALDWALSAQDLFELAKLHKANRYRTKIEDLLEDCNFHTECDMMFRGDYSVWL